MDILCLDLPVLSGITGRYNLIEIERNLRKKIPAALHTYEAYLNKLKLEIIPLPLQKDIKHLDGVTSDKDLPVLASTINANADYLVTGDKKFYLSAGRKHKLPFKIVTPAEFLSLILPEILKSLGA